MPQGILPFEYQIEKTPTGMTARAGLPIYLDLFQGLQLPRSIEENVRVRKGSRGYDDVRMILSLILLNLAGGDAVEDIKVVGEDRGLAEVLKHLELQKESRQRRRDLLRRWRKARTKVTPSPSSIFRYLERFHDPAQEEIRTAKVHQAFVPKPNEHLCGLRKVNEDLVAQAQVRAPEDTATLDLDATLVETTKRMATFCYKGFKAFQPLNVWWAEHELMLHTEFRDGSVSANFENVRVFQEALERLPASVEKVAFRSDCAAYQVALMRYCDQGGHPKFGRIRFAISVPVDREFKESVAEMNQLHDEEPAPKDKPKVSPWKPLFQQQEGKDVVARQEWAQVHHEPSWQTHSRKQRIDVRFFAIREPFEERTLPGLETEQQQQLPFQTVPMGQKTYKLFGVVTNQPGNPEDIIRWHRKRCGKSEEAHAVQKTDFAGGRLPSAKFGANAAWWQIMVLAMNLNTILKRLVLATIDEGWLAKRMKAIRYHVINVAGRVVAHARRLLIRLARDDPSSRLLIQARARILALAHAS